MLSSVASITPGPAPSHDVRLRETAAELETAFLTEMLKHAGLAEAFGTKSTGESDAFAGYLLQAVAERVTAQGGIGLADRFYAELAARDTQSAQGDHL